MSFKHVNTTYVLNRTLQKIDEILHPNEPWLTKDFRKFIDQWLGESDVGLEFGSGRSTAWFAQRVCKLYSVEHNPEWHRIVCNKLEVEKLTSKVEYFFLPDNDDEDPNSSYACFPRTLGLNSVDFVLIDGSSRARCADESIGILRSGGILIIDNVERYIPQKNKTSSPCSRELKDGYPSEIWQSVHSKFKDWRCVWTTNGVSDTAAWVKP